MRPLTALLLGIGILCLAAPASRAGVRDAIAAELAQLLQERLEVRTSAASPEARPRALPEWRPPLPTQMRCRDLPGARSECRVSPRPARS